MIDIVKPGSLWTEPEPHPIADDPQAGRDERAAPWDRRLLAGTVGAPLGLSGAEAQTLALSWGSALVIAFLVIMINIMSRRHMMPSEPAPAAFVDEFSSGAALIVAYVFPVFAALALHRRFGPLWLVVTGLMTGVIAFATTHIGGFILLRMLLYPGLVARQYQFGPLSTELPYEFGKDVGVFVIATAGTLAMFAWRGAGAPLAPPAEAVMFDIQDGQRLIRTPIADIRAVRSAGNYTEFHLSDGRCPLMRASLASLLAQFAAYGFVRTHRSWLVSSAHVTGLIPQGSGDYSVEIGEMRAPLSRRFPEALAVLRRRA